MDKPVKVYKYVIIGDEGVGKTSVSFRYTEDVFNDRIQSTIGVDFLSKRDNTLPIRINIWDTAGACRFHSIVKSFFRSCVGAIVVYDITYRKSFDSVKKWIQEVRELSPKETKIMLIGNKSDSEKREVETEEAKKFAYRENIPFYEVSAKTGKNVKEAFCYFNRINYESPTTSYNLDSINLHNVQINEKCFCV